MSVELVRLERRTARSLKRLIRTKGLVRKYVVTPRRVDQRVTRKRVDHLRSRKKVMTGMMMNPRSAERTEPNAAPQRMPVHDAYLRRPVSAYFVAATTA